jgi:hypothetical protein
MRTKSLIREVKVKSKRDMNLLAMAFVSAASMSVTLFDVVVSFLIIK